jgi:hypothetical protein
MWSHESTVYVCPFDGLAMALALPALSERQSLGTINAALSDHDYHPRMSCAWVFERSSP